MVTATAASGSLPVERNWKAVSDGIVRQVPGVRRAMSDWFPLDRHISPVPDRIYQISATLQCRTARETCPAGSRKCAMLPPGSESRRRTSDPSGAMTSHVSGKVVVAPGCIVRSMVGRSYSLTDRMTSGRGLDLQDTFIFAKAKQGPQGRAR